MKMNKQEVYCTYFPEWFEKYTKKRGLDLFLAGRHCTLAMNLILNPFKLGTTEYDHEWSSVCFYLLEIDEYDNEARKALIEDVVKYAVDEYSLEEYTSTTYISGIDSSETFYMR